MPFDDYAALARLLPGRWTVKATNFPMWLSGENRDPVIEYGLLHERPLRVSDVVTYTESDGKHKTMAGTNAWTGVGFRRRTRGIGGVFARSRWEVAGARQGLVVLRFEQSLAMPSGLDVMVGENLDATELRRVIAADPTSFGLTIEEFASLTWLDHLPPLE